MVFSVSSVLSVVNISLYFSASLQRQELGLFPPAKDCFAEILHIWRAHLPDLNRKVINTFYILLHNTRRTFLMRVWNCRTGMSKITIDEIKGFEPFNENMPVLYS